MQRPRDTSDPEFNALKRELAALVMRMERAAAEILSMSRGLSFDHSTATFERLREMVEDERIKARGRIRFASGSLDLADAGEREEERRILAEQALEEFLAPTAPASLVAPAPPGSHDER